jgi:hypothetical protein
MKLYIRTVRGKKASYREATLPDLLSALISRVRRVFGPDTSDHLNVVLFTILTRAQEYSHDSRTDREEVPPSQGHHDPE